MIHVAGGSYFERCREPDWRFLFGSGLRAAIQLRALGSRVRLHTFVSDRDRDLLKARAAEHGIAVSAHSVPSTIVFDYDHGLATPTIIPDPRRRDYRADFPELPVTAKNLVCFGLIEGQLKVSGDQVVYDPQSPTEPASFRKAGCEANRLAIIANRSELSQLSGSKNIEAACRTVLRREKAEVVVAKLGPAGCFVVTAGGATAVPAFRTQTVFPIGSGDTFSAAFAHAWIEEKMSPAASARFASRAAALYCQSRFPHSKRAITGNSLDPLRLLPVRERKQVYLAGPFFNAGERWVIEQLRVALLNSNVRVFSPLHDVGHGDAGDVYGPDMKGLWESGVVLAWLDGLDAGTLYEIGYAHALGRKVIVFVGPERPEDLKMITGGGCHVVDDLTTAVYLTTWAANCR